MSGAEPLLEVEGVGKRYPGVHALDGVSVELRRGEVHGLIGENGAGKSTLIRILSGATRPDEGTLRLHGEEVQLGSPAEARRHGIVSIFQELAIEPWLTVADNVVLGEEPTWGGQLLSSRRARERTRAVLDRLGATSLDPRTRAGTLGTAEKQLNEIARAGAIEAPLIIMDEPTASLPARDAEQLLRIVRELRERGSTVLFVSHRLDEVRAVADRITVLRNGRLIHTGAAAELPTSRMIELMVGRSVDELFPPPPPDTVGTTLFEARGLARGTAFRDVSFQVRSGEIVAFAGLIGAGRTEVMRAIAGADVLDAGETLLNGRPLRIRSPRDAVAAGIAYLPEDRRHQGLVLSLSGRENMAMASLKQACRLGFVRSRAVRTRTSEVAERLRVRGSVDAPAATLSGGNQQKLVIGKWIMSNARLLIFDEPTRGIDVGAKPEVYRLMYELAERGAGIVLVSSELPEAMHVSHRMLVMSGGEIRDELARGEYEERRIMRAAFGAHAEVGATGGAA